MSGEHAFPLVWLTGPSCDGCTIKALGDSTAGGLEALLAGTVPGLPRIHLLHPLLSPLSGTEFVDEIRQVAGGARGAYGVVNEASVPADTASGEMFLASLGEEDGRPVSIGRWLDRLAPGAEFVVAWGDCAVWGGPHSLEPNPSGATGTSMWLDPEFRSRRGLPVVNLPGCAPPHVLLGTLESLLRWMVEGGDTPALDDLGRPTTLYPDPWKGGLVTWSE